MSMFKRIDLYVLKNFMTLFAATFFICSFILIMQFLWLKIGELVGKGLPFSVLLELFFYIWLTMVPLALPLAILLASLMTFGDMGERLELLAMKSAGISLFRIMRSLIVFIAFVSVGAFAFSNNVIPFAQKQMWTLFISIGRTSPELNIPVGEFYSGISHMRLYVRNKDHKTGALLNVMMYDFSDGFDRSRVITADTVYVRMTEDKRNLILSLINGEMFENLRKNSQFKSENEPYRRETFRRREMVLDHNGGFEKIDGSALNSQSVSKDLAQLVSDIDSLTVARDSLTSVLVDKMVQNNYFDNAYRSVDSLAVLDETRCYNADSLFNNLSYMRMRSVVGRMRSDISNMANDYQYEQMVFDDCERTYVKHAIEMHRKFTLSLACLIFFFIGAPLGAIIRKGGLGMPAVVSIVMFVAYYIIDTFGVKMAKEYIWDAWAGMWLSSMVLLPIGVFLTYKAATDSDLFNKDAYMLKIKAIVAWVKVRVNLKVLMRR